MRIERVISAVLALGALILSGPVVGQPASDKPALAHVSVLVPAPDLHAAALLRWPSSDAIRVGDSRWWLIPPYRNAPFAKPKPNSALPDNWLSITLVRAPASHRARGGRANWPASRAITRYEFSSKWAPLGVVDEAKIERLVNKRCDEFKSNHPMGPIGGDDDDGGPYYRYAPRGPIDDDDY